MALALYIDECVAARIVAGLRRRGGDVLTAGEEGLLGAPDSQQLQNATRLNRVVVTSDSDFLVRVRDKVAAGENFPGLIFIQPRTSVGDAVRAIAMLGDVDHADMVSSIAWVP